MHAYIYFIYFQINWSINTSYFFKIMCQKNSSEYQLLFDREVNKLLNSCNTNEKNNINLIWINKCFKIYIIGIVNWNLCKYEKNNITIQKDNAIMFVIFSITYMNINIK